MNGGRNIILPLALAGGIILLASGAPSHFRTWLTGWLNGVTTVTSAGNGTQSLPDAGGPGTPNTPVNAGAAGTGSNGQPSTLNGPAPGSALSGLLFPSGPTPQPANNPLPPVGGGGGGGGISTAHDEALRLYGGASGTYVNPAVQQQLDAMFGG